MVQHSECWPAVVSDTDSANAGRVCKGSCEATHPEAHDGVHEVHHNVLQRRPLRRHNAASEHFWEGKHPDEEVKLTHWI